MAVILHTPHRRHIALLFFVIPLLHPWWARAFDRPWPSCVRTMICYCHFPSFTFPAKFVRLSPTACTQCERGQGLSNRLACVSDSVHSSTIRLSHERVLK